MKNTKKVLSVALAGALAFGSMGSAFAMDAKLTEGIDNQDVVKAIEKLNAFDIVNGMEDGKYHAEMELTRAQFSKMLVEALGLGSAAKNSTHKPAFNDVDASCQWAWGYINVAQGQGILSGYPDGTFKPSAKVSYAEALTMLVRSLGYKDEFLAGSWPGNYMAKAAEVDVTDGVEVEGTSVNRGAAALLLSNTLDANIIKQATYGDEDNWIVDENKTLIEDKLDVEKYEDAQVIAIPRVDGSIDKDQIKIAYKDDDNKDREKTIDVDLEKVSIDNLLGEGLNVYYDTTDKEVVFVEDADKDFKTYYDVIDEDETVDEDEFTIINADKEVNVDEDVVYYIDNKEVNQKEFTEQAKKGNLFVKAVANEKGNIAIVDAQEWEKDAIVAVKADEDKLTYFDADEDTREIKAKDYDKVVVMDAAGNVMKLEDIKANDVVYVNDKDLDGDDLELAADKDEVLQLVVVRNAVEGAGESWNSSEFEIANKDYDVAKNATVSVNENKDVDLYGSSSSELNDITGEDAKVLALLDLVGDIRHITTDVKSSSDDLYGIITGTDKRYSDVTVKVLNPEGKEVEYELDVDTDDFTAYTDADDVADHGKNDMIKYTVDKDGKIDTIEKIKSVDDTGVIPTGKAGTGKEITESSIVLADGTHIVSDDVVVFDYTAAYESGKIGDADDAEIVKWADLEDKTVASNTEVVYAKNDDGEIEALFFVKDFDLVEDDTLMGYVLKINTKDGDEYAEIMLPGATETKRYELDSAFDTTGSNANIAEDTVVKFVETSNGKIKPATSSDVVKYTGKVMDLSGKTLVVQTDASSSSSKVTLRLASDALYYETDDVMSYSDLDENDYVTVVADRGIVEVVKLYDTDMKSLDDEADKFLDEAGDSSADRTAWLGLNADDNDSTPTPSEDGKVTYINADGNMIVGEDTYEIGATTILKDETGKVIAVGKSSIDSALSVNDTVKDIVVENGVVKTFVRVSTDAEIANKVIALIHDLPAAGAVAVADKADIEAARAAYDALTTAQKALVDADATDNNTRLATLEAELASLTVVEDVKALIAALPASADVTVAHKAQIEAARAAFAPLTAAQKTAVGDITKLTDAETALADLEAASADETDVADAKAALTTLVVTNADQAAPSIAVPTTANGVSYSFAAPANFNGNDDVTTPGDATDADPVVITRDASTLFTFEIEVTFTKNAATDTKVFVVTVPTGTDAVTVSAK
ncbi:S-layer homology domain-containing protein [Tepidibacter aestuarii]|uniref:S-layer homology domain-containing protein n=1 Tax=Tepidibacter aestuarii TaxID=2925782 RepID=UPI0020BF5FD1|nr:S-layer homology domain-containing protein [Tepidibacter aestuarii]CAH2215103.1 Middle cell wall protein [Tepidibacter aestuarii]